MAAVALSMQQKCLFLVMFRYLILLFVQKSVEAPAVYHRCKRVAASRVRRTKSKSSGSPNGLTPRSLWTTIRRFAAMMAASFQQGACCGQGNCILRALLLFLPSPQGIRITWGEIEAFRGMPIAWTSFWSSISISSAGRTGSGPLYAISHRRLQCCGADCISRCFPGSAEEADCNIWSSSRLHLCASCM